MKKFVVLLEAWNEKHEHDCMCYVIKTTDDIDSILNVEELAKRMAKNGYPQFDNFETLYIKELLNR